MTTFQLPSIKQCLLVPWFLLITTILGCQTLPKTPHLSKSIALGYQSQMYKPSPILDISHPQSDNLSGYHLILKGTEAFTIRRNLSQLATQSIDIQYYIWHDDEAGELLLQDLWAAANRGVIIRLLLDDINSSPALDQRLLMFASHPNIAVRLINPVAHRHARPISYLTDPKRLNRRMHNKSMIFDKSVSIIGGRNIGNEYLSSLAYNQFADLDVLLTGKATQQISTSFESYWHSPLSFDVEILVKPNQHQLTQIQKKTPTIQSTIVQYPHTIKNLTLNYAPIEFVSDDVKKLQGNNNLHHTLIDTLQQKFGTPKETLSIISSYFVPTKEGVNTLTTLAKHGVRINILTNSYDATDVGIVHAGYAPWRKDLLKAGVRLYELKATNHHSNKNHKDNRLWRTHGKTTTSLHAKTFAVDKRHLFIGSYNIDPRSANFNTEMGVIIDDPHLTQQMHDVFGDNLLHQAYELKLNNNQLEWHTLENGQPLIHTQEPNMQQGDKLMIFLLSFLPIDWLL